MTEPVRPGGPDGTSREPDGAANPRPKTPLEQMGGASGLVFMALPIVAFVFTNASWGLPVAVCTAVGISLGISVLRLVRKQPLLPALSGLLGVTVAALMAWWTGSAKGFFLLGIWGNLGLAVLFLLSVVVRRPLAGVVWGALNGTGMPWLNDKPSRRYYGIATLILTLLFAARFFVQNRLYAQDATGWLATARIVMGYPLFAVAFLAVLWAARRSSQRLKALADVQESA